LSLAFMEEIEFYQEIHKQLKYRRGRYDGQGARDGLKKEELPIGARMIKVVSHYLEETVSGKSPHEIMEGLKDGAGQEFDPKIVDIFINLLEKEGKEV
ncbi:MAG: HD domain-containing phosphohydrolase, partial [Actinomycetota bacterium]|nr:HD domain-containing phosphohydrolase [Actinomycetota bacterium]